MLKHLFISITILLLTIETSPEIFLIQFTLPAEMEIWYNSNWNNPHARGDWTVCHVYGFPDTSSEIIGTIHSQYNNDIKNFVLYYRPVDSQDLLVWNDSLGDWGYGIYTYSLEISADFARLPLSPFPEDSWIRVGHQFENSLKGEIEPLLGRIVRLQKVSAMNWADPSGIQYLFKGIFSQRICNRACHWIWGTGFCSGCGNRPDADFFRYA